DCKRRSERDRRQQNCVVAGAPARYESRSEHPRDKYRRNGECDDEEDVLLRPARIQVVRRHEPADLTGRRGMREKAPKRNRGGETPCGGGRKKTDLRTPVAHHASI